MKILAFAAFVALGVAVVPAQDAVSTLPQAYKLQFENEWVKVVRVRYEAYVKLPAHAHTAFASAYVYLNDAGPVIFKHIGLAYGAITRPATKAGSFRLYRAVEEIHEVENTSALPSDFLRVEFKTDPKNELSLRGKFFREPYPAGENVQKVQFENEQVQITRLVCAAGRALDVATTDKEPALLIALSPARLELRQDASPPAGLAFELGETRWVPVNQVEHFANTGTQAAEMLRVDFKTGPLRSR